MRHPYEKFIKIELAAVGCAVLFGLVALIQGYLFLVIISFFLIALSLLFDALICWRLYKTIDASKHLARAVMLMFLITYVVFHL